MYPSKGICALTLASISFGTSAILIRYATEVSPLSLTFFRLGIAAVAMVLFALGRKSLTVLARRDLALVMMSGVMLCLHFSTFIMAVKFTTVANATFLVNTSPVMLAVLSPIIIRERTTSRESIGVLVATLGILIVAGAGDGFNQFRLGDASALFAAFSISFYSLIGRSLRTRGMKTGCYTAYVYSIATITALSLVQVLEFNMLRTYDTINVAAIFGLALVPTMFGHSLYNYSLGSVKTVIANLFPLLEPIMASALAILLFREIPTLTQIAGYLLILAAVVVVGTSSIDRIQHES